MSSAHEAIGVAAELFTWIGLGGALLCFATLLLVAAVRGRQVCAEAVLTETASGVQVRWLAEDGVLRSRAVTPAEAANDTDPDELVVYYHRRSPDRVELEPVDHAERVLRLLGYIFLGVGLVAAVAQVVVMVTG